ncbi:protein TsetseEP-like [Rhagoletis pomonella]|uniref:protein TsetseEP-like n=1 Tax=Rhagoletis pomonella TaxID=28610 RepID=UPI0017816F82|nr:protein TsetseEP-like [Rhagoletis pomonella]
MLKIVVCILSTILATVFANRLPLDTHIADRAAELSLGNFLLARQARISPTESAECFDTYEPLMQQAAAQWSSGYQECLQVAQTDRNAILEAASQSQKEISTEAASVCSYVQTCTAVNSSLDALDCFADLSSNTLSPIYVISNNASDLAGEIREQLNVIDVNSYKCCNATERKWVETTARLSDALNYCLQFGPPEIVTPASSAQAQVASDARRDIQLVSAPRRTPIGRILANEAEAPEAAEPNREISSNLILAFNNWLQQNGNRGVANV